MQQKRAVIFFLRDERTEAAVKPLPAGHSRAGYRAVNERLVERLGTLRAHGCDLVVAGERGTTTTGTGRAILQRGDSFGERITNAITDAFARGYSEVVVVGNDCPTITPDDVTVAFTKLALGAAYAAAPASDGGAYLVGASADAFDADAFGALPWCSSRLFAALAALPGAATLPIEREDFDRWSDPRARRALTRLLARRTAGHRAMTLRLPMPARMQMRARARIHLPAPPRN